MVRDVLAAIGKDARHVEQTVASLQRMSPIFENKMDIYCPHRHVGVNGKAPWLVTKDGAKDILQYLR